MCSIPIGVDSERQRQIQLLQEEHLVCAVCEAPTDIGAWEQVAALTDELPGGFASQHFSAVGHNQIGHNRQMRLAQNADAITDDQLATHRHHRAARQSLIGKQPTIIQPR